MNPPNQFTSKTPVYVLCAGEGTRLFPFNSILPKCMMPIGPKPCVAWIIEQIERCGFSDIRLIVRTSDFGIFGREFRDKKAVTVLTDDDQGTAGHFFSRRFLESQHSDILLWYGDCLIDADIKDLLQMHQDYGCDATLLLSTKVRLEYGLVKTRGHGRSPVRQVVSVQEKPVMDSLIWTGIVALKQDAFAPYIRPGDDFAKDVFPKMMTDGRKVCSVHVGKEWLDIGSYVTYKRANDLAQRGELFSGA